MMTYGKLPYRSYYIYHLDFYDLYKNGEILDKTLVLNLDKSKKIFNNTSLNKLDKKGDCHLFDQTKKGLAYFEIPDNDYYFTNVYVVIDFKNYLDKTNSNQLYRTLLSIRNGIKLYINDQFIHFVDFLKSNSMSKNCCILYVNSIYKSYLEPRFTFGLDKGEYVLSKWYAYSGLLISDATLIDSIHFAKDEIVIIPDKEKDAKIDCITAVSIDYVYEKVSDYIKYLKDLQDFEDVIDSNKSVKENYDRYLLNNTSNNKERIILRNLFMNLQLIVEEFNCYYNSKDYKDTNNLSLLSILENNSYEDIINFLIGYCYNTFSSNTSILEERHQFVQLKEHLSKYMDKEHEIKWIKFNVHNLPIAINKFDGQGLISKELGIEINNALKKLSNNENQKFGFTYQIRLPFIKGIVSSCDIKEFFKEKNIEYIYGKTYNGQELRAIDINKVKVILTESQFKCNSFLHNIKDQSLPNEAPIDTFIRLLNKYEYCLGVSNLEPEHDKRVNLNYQFLTTLPLNNSVKHFIRNINYGDFRQMTKVENIAKEIIKESKDENEIELFRKYPKVYYSTEKFNIKRKFLRRNYLKRYFSLNYSAKGYRKYLCSDLLELLYHCAYHKTKNNTTLEYLPLNKFYAPNTTFEENEKCIFLRNPHYSRNEIGVLVNSKEKFTERGKYFKHLTGVIMYNPLSMLAQRLGGADYDGDTVVILSEQYFSKTISRMFKNNQLKYPLVSIPSLNAPKKAYNFENRARSIADTFNSRVGAISNIALNEAFNIYDNKAKDTDGIAFFTILNGLEIDSAKKGVKPNIQQNSENALAKEYLKIKDEIDTTGTLSKETRKLVTNYKDMNSVFDMLSRTFNFKIIRNNKIRVKKVYNIKDIKKEDVIDLIEKYATYKYVLRLANKTKQKLFMNHYSDDDYVYLKIKNILEKKYPNEFTNHTVVMKFIDSVALSTSELQKTLKVYCDEKYNKFHYLSSYSDKVNYIENTLGIKDLTKEQLDILCDFKDDGYLLLYLILYYLYNEYMKAPNKDYVDERIIDATIESCNKTMHAYLKLKDVELKDLKTRVKARYLHLMNDIPPCNLSFVVEDDLKSILEKTKEYLTDECQKHSYETYLVFKSPLCDEFEIDIFTKQLLAYLNKNKGKNIYGKAK